MDYQESDGSLLRVGQDGGKYFQGLACIIATVDDLAPSCQDA